MASGLRRPRQPALALAAVEAVALGRIGEFGGGCSGRAVRVRLRLGGSRSTCQRVEIAIAFGPLEHLSDRVLGHVTGKLELPGEVTVLGVEFRERRQRSLRRRRPQARRARRARATCAAGRCRAPAARGRDGSEIRQRATVAAAAAAGAAGAGRRRGGCRCGGSRRRVRAGCSFLRDRRLSRSNCRSETRCASIGCFACTARSIARMTSTDFSSRSDTATRHLHRAAAQLIEQRLEAVREGGDVGEAEGRAATLDGMRDAENGVDQLRLGRADIELQERRLHGIERLEALLEEGGMELCQIDRHRPASAGSSSMSRRPRRPAAVSRAGARPRHATARPAVRRSRTNAARSCNPAVSMRCRALTSRVTGSGSCSRHASSALSASASATVHSAARRSDRRPPGDALGGGSRTARCRAALRRPGTRALLLACGLS